MQTDLLREMTEKQWQIAHAMAIALVQEEADVNELGKAIAYLRASLDRPNAGSLFFRYVKTLVKNGNQIGHSKKTLDYYRSLDNACTQYLQNEQENPYLMLQILGWVARLMRYYKVSPIEEIAVPAIASESSRQAEIAAATSTHIFTVGQILDAKITTIQGNQVTYEMLGTIKLSVKEPKRADLLSPGKMVKVEITQLKDDGGIKKVKWVE